MAVVDLNSDLGESFLGLHGGDMHSGDDEAMFALVTSANLACGFHAGDSLTMLRSCRLAASAGTSIGAHVSYRDLEGFGRREMDVAPAALHADVLYQLAAISGIAAVAGTAVRYVKPHGALYNRIVHDEEQAWAVAEAVRDFDDLLPLLGLPGSAIELAAASADLEFFTEGFADRAYRADGSLVPRSESGSVLTDPAEVAARAVELAGQVDSLCVHGDTPGAVALATATRAALAAAGIEVRAFR